MIKSDGTRQKVVVDKDENIIPSTKTQMMLNKWK